MVSFYCLCNSLTVDIIKATVYVLRRLVDLTFVYFTETHPVSPVYLAIPTLMLVVLDLSGLAMSHM